MAKLFSSVFGWPSCKRDHAAAVPHNSSHARDYNLLRSLNPISSLHHRGFAPSTEPMRQSR